MSVTPGISTPHEDVRTLSGQESETWNAKYAAYLKSSEWHRRRNAALRRAQWTCSRCPTQHPLEVHHLSYARLGRELDADLEVLCPRCHEGLHIDEHQQVRGVYVVVVSDVLKREKFTCLADLMEAVKVACARRKIPYDGRKVYRAVSLVEANRHGVIDAPKPRVPIVTAKNVDAMMGRPVTKAEAMDCLRTLGIAVSGYSMPTVERDDYYRDMEKANQIRRQAEAMR